MPVHNVDIAELFNQTADVLEIQGANAFRVRAYRNAARVVASCPTDLAATIKEGHDLPKLPGVGQDLGEKIAEIATKGRLPILDDLKRKVPEGLLELLKLPGMGPKRAKALQIRLGVESITDLERVARSGKVRELEGFGQKTENKILSVLESRARKPVRVKLANVEPVAKSLVGYLKQIPGVRRVEVAGSFRRWVETVGDLDILISVSANAESNVMERFLSYEDVASVASHGETRSTVNLKSGLQVDVRVVSDESYGAALHYFTGSKAHNIAIRLLGVRRGLKINEYGIFRGSRHVGGRTEEEVYASVSLPFIEPELRENQGEIEAAQKRELPKLLAASDIRGDLHVHTKETDGRHSLEEMVDAAEALGYQYLAVTDHSRHLTVARGLTPARLKAQIRKIDKFNETSRGPIVLKAIECDILEDGSLDLPDDVLALLDLRVCSIHSKFDLPGPKQTERVVRAMDNRYFNILAHPTGRLIGQREPYALNLERVIEAARDRGRVLEINSQPDRMDLSSVYARLAKKMGVRLAISTDAHSNNDLAFMRFGVAVARRGWLERDDIINTRGVDEVKKLLKPY